MSENEQVVSVEWLWENLENPQVAIADCRFRLNNPSWGFQQYSSSHIPGAYYLNLDRDLSAPVAKHGGRHPLPNPKILAQKLAAMGIDLGETFVVAYDDFNFAFAARLWWLLRYLGHERVAILNGGWSAWLQGGYPVTQAIPAPKSGNFVPQLISQKIADLETVRTRKDLSGTILVDSRSHSRYRGETEPIDPIAGHIPGAVNFPWSEVSEEAGYLRPLPELKQHWSQLDQAEEIIVYCGSGVTACVNLLSLESLGIKNAKLYPGGWSDWCSYII
ncbi:sulfurtransferase [Oscillatoria salina]|uniref:sulfurtransferase n=1 Tax=Oscillatoria salina TaxID=331517 RepID=UPI0013B7A2A6|nr:sulfurtransferase [Oscillatoria salina]MBZ8179482.1 sulfurtransferase [Oscillatoria salina IIICB1]NET88536.1 sulfurtransferase [Kamptonema sp. SIO1D9]